MKKMLSIVTKVAFTLSLVFFLSNCKSRESFRSERHSQEPKQPFPYFSEDIEFNNSKAGVRLAGTFTRPTQKRNYPVVVLISGSGPKDRNEEVNQGHKPFLIIADFLTRKGIAVLRYDDLNHFFQECETGSPDEYTIIDQTFSPMALSEMSSWILKQVN
ncbi:alpha/beta hydrolase family protein [Dyadobacter luticola]|uniref:Alpha/beta hydrolase n=1 Tax=Dyadobacter luticola TaxID=1979387 RepID=A0A5R9KL89_9BACT|nr:hypothetical protein [Dyadobacter luticola]TLU96991.1 hypothetical protein FEN17_27100 [Dyadobacter luticola]